MQGYYFAKPVTIAHIPAAKAQAKEAFKALTLK
jgi:EAL domain-containing protein (putative c-di-GMP-specific phosphodiesterase class I)